MPRPSSSAYQRRLIARHGRYLRPWRLIRGGTCAQAAPRTSAHERESSAPWLPHRWCCPIGSLLTMATSAPLRATQRLMPYSVRLRVPPPATEGPHFTLPVPSPPGRRPYSGGPGDGVQRGLHRRFCLHPLGTGSATTCPPTPNQGGCVTKLPPALQATAWRGGSPGFGQGFYDRACAGRGAPSRVGYDGMVHRHLPSPDLHRLDWQPDGLQTKNTENQLFTGDSQISY